MNYVIAAYGITVAVLAGYAWNLARERRALSRSEDAARDDERGG